MDLKAEFKQFVIQELGIPLVGIAMPDDISPEDIQRINPVIQTFAKATPLAEGLDSVLQPRDFLDNPKSVVITGMPAYFGKMSSLEECREGLLGKAEPSHVNSNLLQANADKNARIGDFFTEKGLQCVPAVGMQLPIKLWASKCGVGFYGKNSVIQHPDYGAWISLSAFITDAEMASDEPLAGDCGSCELCMKACPTQAIFAPYQCDVNRCMDFHLGHNKLNIPDTIREKTGNLLGEGCTVCRDVCPKNQKLTPLSGYEVPDSLRYPSLLKVLAITDDEWENSFAMTLMGFFLMDKKYLIRNALISLGNFRDERAIEALADLLKNGADELRGYAAWALGNIGDSRSRKILQSAAVSENNALIQREIEAALGTARSA